MRRDRRAKPHPLRRIVRLFPEEFRSRWSADIEQVFDDQIEAARTPRERRRVWIETLTDILSAAPREHAAILLQDARVAVRGMRSQLPTTLAVVATLAIGIGATSSIFGLVRTTLLQPLPFEHEDRLVRIYLADHGQQPWISLRPDLFEALERGTRSFDGLVAQRFTDMSLRQVGGARQISGMAVSAGWLDVLGVRPQLGRGFSADEETAGRASHVALISHGFWQRHFGGRRSVLGEELPLDGETFRVIGVLPEGFHYPYGNDIWIPLALAREAEGVWGLNVQARRRPGVSLDTARTELETLGARLASEEGHDLMGRQLFAVPTRQVLLDDQESSVLALLLSVAFLLLLVCVNIGYLLLARSIHREREMALRAALGASRLRQTRQILTETSLLAALGGAGGLVLSKLLTPLLDALIPGRLGNLVAGVQADTSVTLFALTLTVIAGLLFGVAPARRATRKGLERVVRASARTGAGRNHSRRSGGLILGESILAFVLLAGSFSAILHYRHLLRSDLGYDPSPLVVANVALDAAGYSTSESRTRVLQEVEERLAALPGTVTVGSTCLFPSRGGNFLAQVEIEGRVSPPEERNIVNHRLVTADFFGALGLPVLRGRGLLMTDRGDSAPVVVVSEGFAERYWPGEDPIGRRVRNARPGADDAWRTVVGVVADLREFYDVAETWYLPWAQNAEQTGAGSAVLVLRLDVAADLTEANELTAIVRQAISEVDPALPLERVLGVEALHAEELEDERLGSALATAFAGFGLTMALLGIGGIAAFVVAGRSREIALRRALGAPRSAIVRDLVRDLLRWVAPALVVGVALHLALGRTLATILPGTGTDAQSGSLSVFGLGGVALVVVTIALLAAAPSAARATRISPARVLRE